MDRDFGPFFLKFPRLLPVQRQAAAGQGRDRLHRARQRHPSLRRSGAAAGDLRWPSAAKIDALLRKWLHLLPHPFTAADRRAGYRTFHILRDTHGSTLAMRGVPLPVIAKQLGHADTRMTERHYAHLSPSYVAETIRASFPTLGIVEQGKVASLRPRKA